MVKCMDCGAILEEDELDSVECLIASDDGGYHKLYEREHRCPKCGGRDIYDAVQCVECGGFLYAGNGTDDVPSHWMGGVREWICEDCLKKTSLDETVAVGKRDAKLSVNINAFLASAFTAAEIEDILVEALKKNPTKAIEEYVTGDPDWFAWELGSVRKERQ
jgi:hypothetical protein